MIARTRFRVANLLLSMSLLTLTPVSWAADGTAAHFQPTLAERVSAPYGSGGYQSSQVPTGGVSSGHTSQTYATLVSRAYAAAGEGKHDEAVTLFRQALAIAAHDGQVWAGLGISAGQAKRYDDVIEAGNKVLELGAFGATVRAIAYFEMACAYAGKGDPKAAWEHLNLAMKSGFRNLNQIANETRLESLKSHPDWITLVAGADTSKMTRDEGWAYDLWLLDRELRRLHFAPYLKYSPQERDQQVADLKAKLPQLTDDQILVEFFRYIASYGDGHTNMRMRSLIRPRIQLFWFDEGIHVVAAHPDHKNIVGAKLLGVEGHAVESLIPKVQPLIAHENPQGLKASTPNFITNLAVLRGLELSKSTDAIKLRVQLASGKTEEVSLPCVANFQAEADWAVIPATKQLLGFKNRDANYWFEYLPQHNVVYCQYNSVRSSTEEPLPKFAERLYQEVDKHPNCSLVLDVRWNGGGNTFLSQPLLEGLWARPALSRSGNRLYVITGRNTFSAAQNFTTDISRSCAAIFVGEPTGSSPNFIGESVPFTLRYSRLSGSISDLYWQRSWPMDYRIWIAPDLPASPSIRALERGVDPCMEAVIANVQVEFGKKPGLY